MDHNPISILILLCVLLNLTYGEMYTSTARLAKMFEGNAFIVDKLDQYIQKEETRLNMLKGVKNDILTLKGISLGSSFSMVEHPVGAFHVIQTFHRLERAIHIGKQGTQDFTDALKTGNIDLPTLQDSEGAFSAILRLQRIYNLKAEDLVKGVVRSRQIAGITADAAFEIGNVADTQDINKPLSVEWWEAALQQNASQLTPQNHKQLLLKLSQRYMELGKTSKAAVYLNHTLHFYGTDVDTDKKRMTNTLEDIMKTGIDFPTLPLPEENLEYNVENYRALCRGDPSAIVSDPFTSFCILMPGSIPYDPVKVEVLNTDPFVAMFHDVISEKEASALKQTAFQLLERAKTGPSHDPSTSEIRVGQLTWVPDTIPVIKKISTRIETITRLDVTIRDLLSSSEPFQVVNYGIGGHYEPHRDYFDRDEELLTLPDFLQNSGERLATFLFYLNNVEDGGATVFPSIGVRVPPIKNAAAFWFNLHRSGERDNRTLHAGCPVLLGQKWVANKWIRQHGNAYRHGCGLHIDDVHYTFDKEKNNG